MNHLHLREPNENDRDAVMAYREEFLQIHSLMAGTSFLEDFSDFDAWLDKLRQYRRAETVPEGKVPATALLALDETERLIGMVNIRHSLNDYLLHFGGHIGYSVRPCERRKDFAKEILHLALAKANRLGLARVLVCCDQENIGSQKTILANGGILENEVLNVSDGTITQRYWIECGY